MLANPKDPSFLSALVYFHHAAEALSFSQAAKVLNVTPSAISHRIATLESALGKRLFDRRVRAVHLTQDGIELARFAARIWDELQAATEQMASYDVLRVSIGPYLSSQWLLRRLGDFEVRHPDLRVDLIHVIGETGERVADVSIIWSELVGDGKSGTQLFGTKAIPVAAPDLGLKPEFWNGGVPPIHYRDRSAWCHWLSAAGAPLSFADCGDVLDDPHIVLEAAAYGRGVAIGFLPFIGNFIEQGRLAPVSSKPVSSNRGYRLVVNARDHRMANIFASWVIEQAKNETIASSAMAEALTLSGQAGV